MSDFAEDTNVPTNDYISRQTAIRWVKTECNPYGNPTIDFESGKRVIEHLKQMPSAEPERKKGEWIPCSERLPEGDGMELKLVTYIDPREGPCVWLGWYEMEGVWYIDGDAHSKELGNEVTAWLNIPEPYEEAEQ